MENTNKPKTCINCNHYVIGLCTTPESFQFESEVSTDYLCHAFEWEEY